MHILPVPGSLRRCRQPLQCRSARCPTLLCLAVLGERERKRAAQRPRASPCGGTRARARCRRARATAAAASSVAVVEAAETLVTI